MPYKYEINGVIVEFENEPSEQDIDEAAKQLTPKKSQPQKQPTSAGYLSPTAKAAQREPTKDFNEILGGIVEPALTIGTGVPASVLAGLTGIIGSIVPGPEGQGAQWTKDVQESMTYQPRTKTGQENVQAISDVLGYIPEKAGQYTFEKTNSPLLATGSQILADPLNLLAIPQVSKGIGQAAKSAGKGIKNITVEPISRMAEGAASAYRSPKEPVYSTRLPEEILQQAKQENKVGPINELLIRSGNNYIPQKGKAFEAFGENMAREFSGYDKRLPLGLQGMADVAGLFGVGIPMQGSLLRGGAVGAKSLLSPKMLESQYVSPSGLPLSKVEAAQFGDKVIGKVSEVPTRTTKELSSELEKIKNTPKPIPKPTEAPKPVQTEAPKPLLLEYNPKQNIIYGSTKGDLSTDITKLEELLFKKKYPEGGVDAYPPTSPVMDWAQAPRPKPTEAPKPVVMPTEAPRPIRPTEKTKGTNEYKNEIIDELETKVKNNPELVRYANDYVIPEKLQYDIEKFLDIDNTTPYIAYGGPGTGKTQLASQWASKNGNVEYITSTLDKQDIQQLKTQLDVSNSPILLLIDEVDTIPNSKMENLNPLLSHPNARVLYTTNKLNDVSTNIKTKSKILDMNTQLTPEQKEVFGLYRAVVGDMFSSDPTIIKNIAKNSTTFRDIKRNIPEMTNQKDMTTIKQEPIMSIDRNDLNVEPEIQKTLTELVNNGLEKNMVIFDNTYIEKNKNISNELSKFENESSIDDLPRLLLSPNTTSPTYRIIIRNKKDSDKLTNLKGLIERSNESNFPVNLIIENQYGKLDPALYSRGINFK